MIFPLINIPHATCALTATPAGLVCWVFPERSEHGGPERVRERSERYSVFRLFITKGEAARRGVFRPKGLFAFSLLLSLLFRGGSKEVVQRTGN